jgi:hypothetical protein
MKFYMKFVKGAMGTYKILESAFGEKPLGHTINLSILLDIRRGEFLSITTHQENSSSSCLEQNS